MADLRIVDAPLLSTVKGTEKIPTGGEGNFSVSVNQVADFAKLKWVLATEGYVDNAVGNVQADLNLHKNSVSNPHQVTKAQVGLGNVDNTADLDKPLSNAGVAALSLKADKVYVDSQDNLKANKITTYTKTEVDSEFYGIYQNGAALPYDATMEYAEGAVVVKDGELQKKQGAGWVSAANKGYNLDYFVGGKSYPLHAEIMLTNGDIVRSTVANNTVDPNVDMVGWVKVNSTTQIYDDALSLQQSEINKRSSDVLRWITPQEFGAVGDGVTDDSDAFKDCITYAVTKAFIPMNGGNRRIGVGIRIPATEGGYRIAKPQHFIPNLGTTRYAGLVFEGEGRPLIYFDYDDNDYMCYNDNQFLLLQFSNISFYCNSDSSKFLFSTANGGTQGYTFFDCEWNGKWNKLYVLRGVNNNSEWKWIASNITCTVRDVMLDIAESDQFLNYWFYGCKIWLYDGQCVRASAGGHITFISCDWSGLQGNREMCTSTKGKFLFELTGITHARGVCSFRIIDGRFECKANAAGNGINARLLYCEWGQGNVELNIDASSTILSEFDNEYSIHMNRGNAGGAMLSIRSSHLIGKLKFESSTAAFEKNKHTISDTTFGSFNLTRPSDFIEINSPNPNPSGASAVKLDNCRPSVGNGVFNSATLTFTPWDLTLGSRNSLSAGTAVNIAEFKGSSYGGNPTGNNPCYLRLPANSTILSVRILCDGTGTTAMDSTWEVTDDSTGTILLTGVIHKLNQRWIDKSEIPYRSTTGLLKLVDKTAGGQTQSTAGFKCIVEYVC